jgi:GT2 family glycosyltransferase
MCLDRLAPGKQTLDARNYEVIVTDDGSQSTAQQLIAEEFPWARWLPGPGRGPAANRNSGVRNARGEWIAFVDDDCLPDAGWLDAYAGAIRPGVLVYEGRTLCRAGLTSPLLDAPVNLTGGCLWSCNMMMERAAFGRLRGFDEAYPFACEDVDFAVRIRRDGLSIDFVPEASVDHPPRPARSGWQRGLYWESRVMLWYKEGNVKSAWSWMPVHLLKVRIRQALSFPLQFDSFRAAFSLAMEFACVVLHINAWDRRHRPREG